MFIELRPSQLVSHFLKNNTNTDAKQWKVFHKKEEAIRRCSTKKKLVLKVCPAYGLISEKREHS